MKRELAIVLAGGILTVGMQLEVLARGGGGGGGGGGGAVVVEAAAVPPDLAAGFRLRLLVHAPRLPLNQPKSARAAAAQGRARPQRRAGKAAGPGSGAGCGKGPAAGQRPAQAQQRRNPRPEIVPRRVRSEISSRCLAAQMAEPWRAERQRRDGTAAHAGDFLQGGRHHSRRREPPSGRARGDAGRPGTAVENLAQNRPERIENRGERQGTRDQRPQRSPQSI